MNNRIEITRNEAREMASKMYVTEYFDAVNEEFSNLAFYHENWTTIDDCRVVHFENGNIKSEISFVESKDSKPCYIECRDVCRRINLDWNTIEEFIDGIYAVIGRAIME